jgi:hypothetical protein
MPIETRADLQCPTCGASQEWSDSCRRCKCDLRLLRSAERAYERHRLRCLKRLSGGDSAMALAEARLCDRLRPGAESNRLMALCQLLRENWPEALDLAGRVAQEAAQPEAGFAWQTDSKFRVE